MKNLKQYHKNQTWDVFSSNSLWANPKRHTLIKLHRKTQGKNNPTISPIGFKAKQSGNQTPVVGAEGSDEWSDGSYLSPRWNDQHKGVGGLWHIVFWNFGFRSAKVAEELFKVSWVWELGSVAMKTPPSTKTQKKEDNRTYMKIPWWGCCVWWILWDTS